MSQLTKFDENTIAPNVLQLEGDTGGPVGPTGGIVFVLGGVGTEVAGNPGTSTLLINLTDDVPLQFDADSGSAVPSSNTIVMAGGNLITTSAASDTVTFSLDNGTDGQLIIGSTAGSPAYASVTDGDNITTTPGSNSLSIAVSGTTEHAVQIGNSSGSLTSLALGTSGQILTSNGAGMDPSFQDAASSGQLVLISSQTASTSSGLTFTSIGSYASYFIVGTNAGFSGANSLLLQLSVNNGSSYIATSYAAGAQVNAWNSATITNINNTTGMTILRQSGGDHGISVWLHNMNNGSGAYPVCTGTYSAFNAFAYVGGGYTGATINANAFQLVPTAGTFNGIFTLYGLSTT